ncbi:hypothetical protein BSKO_00215 [Bryopsis sp. KO-2023]|nr:hypothetical protein BSKO_00215 [Bryopsis sp. KO-2023]
MRILALTLLFAVVWSSANAALFAVDLGSEYLKVSLIKPGRVPISVVVNEMSKRKSRAAVAVVDGDRYLADEAFGLRTRRPESVYFRLRDFLGKSGDDEAVKKALSMGHDQVWPVKMVEDTDRGTVRFALNGTDTISAEELVGSILYYAKTITAAQAGENVVECVIAVPVFFGPIQNQAILDAARLIGLEVLALVHSHSAAALQYGIERDFTEKPEDIILYDMGSTTTQVALISFSSFETKEKGKVKSVSQFQIKDATWDEELGGDDLDWLLVEHFATEFKEKHKMDVKESPKAIAKLKLAVRKTKEVLSANAHSPIYIESLHKDIDFSSSITREQFESLAGDFFKRAQKPLQEIIERNSVDISALTNVELIGGGTRVPNLKSVLSEVLGGRQLDRHLDADEAVVMGAGLVAANLSTTFRLRQFGMIDGAFYPVTLKVDEPKDWMSPVGAAEAANLFKPKGLLPFMKRVPAKRVVNLPNFTADPFTFALSFNSSAPHGLPPGAKDEKYSTYEITGTKDAVEKYGEGGKVSLNFKADMAGMISLERADYVNEVVVKPKEKAEKSKEKNDGKAEEGKDSAEASKEDPKKEDAKEDDKEEDAKKEESKDDAKKEAESDAEELNLEEEEEEEEEEEDESADVDEEKAEETEKKGGENEEKKKDENGGKKEEEKPKKKKEKAPKKKTVRFPLKITGPNFEVKGLGQGEMFTASKKVLQNFVKREQDKKLKEKAKNDLESYIYSMQAKLDSDEDVDKVTTEEQRTKFKAELATMEDWLYMEGEDEPTREFKKRLTTLQKTGNAITVRIEEGKTREQTMATAKAYIELIRKAANTWPEAKPWLNKTEIEKLVVKTDEFEVWLTDIETKQNALAPHEDPAFLGNEVLTKLMNLDRPFKRLSNKKGPKPPPPPPPEKANSTEKPEEAKKETENVGTEEAKEEPGGDKNEKSDGKSDHDEL